MCGSHLVSENVDGHGSGIGRQAKVLQLGESPNEVFRSACNFVGWLREWARGWQIPQRQPSPMPPRVYVETTFVSYLTARPSLDVIMAGHQQSTRDWWDRRRAKYELCSSQLVIQEAGAGEVQMAQDRLRVLAPMTQLEITAEAVSLAEELVRAGALPVKAANDALHIAVAAFHCITYLMTWNCRHMANASMRRMIEKVCAKQGYKAPIICTPEELMEDES